MSCLAALLISSLAQAAETAEEPDLSQATQPALHLPEGWTHEPYWRPVVAMTGLGNAYLYAWPLTVGAQGGLRAWDEHSPLVVHARARATITFGSATWGNELRAGVFAGPGFKFFNLSVGPDLFRNTWRVSAHPYPAYVLEPTLGLDLTALATIGPPEFYGMVGTSVALVTNPDRRVDWQAIERVGVGHELEWVLGLVSNSGPLRLGLVYSRRVVANGVQQGWGISAGL